MSRIFKASLGICGLLYLAPLARASDNTPLQFVQDYIHAIGAIEDIRITAEKEQAANPTDFISCIRSTEAWKLELGGDINILNATHLHTGSGADEAPQDIAKIFAEKLHIVEDLSNACTIMVEGPKDGVDYPALASNLPKLTARMNYVDKLIYQVSPLVFITLISTRADSQNHASYLVITRIERTKLLQMITSTFGDRVLLPHPNYADSIGQLFCIKLKEFKAFNDPW